MSLLTPLALLLLLLPPAAAADSSAPAPPPDDVFLLTGKLLLETDGVTDPSARIYAKSGRPGFLVECERLEGMVLVDPTARSVRSLDTDLLIGVGEDGHRLMPGGATDVLCSLVPDGPTAGFALGGHAFRLVPAPHVLGRTTHAELLAGSPEYRRLAAGYEPAEEDLATLAACTTPVQIDVFFGSWCGFCSRFMPRLLRVVEALDNDALSFVFHGMPRQITLDPDASALGVRAVPTAVIFAGGREVGRLEGDGWHRPEVALAVILGGLP